MKRTIILTLLFLGLALAAFSQNYRPDAVYLRNGSVIRGTIVEIVPNRSVSIETGNGHIYRFGMDEVSRISRQKPIRRQYNDYDYNYNNNREPMMRPHRDFGYPSSLVGWKSSLDVGLVSTTTSDGFWDNLFYDDDDDNDGYNGYNSRQLNYFNLSFTTGYQFIPYLFIGVGTGLHFYTDDDFDDVLMPFYFDIRGNFTTGRIIPFAGMKSGYTYNLSDGMDNIGSYFEPYTGVKFMTDYKRAFYVSLSLPIQEFNSYYREKYYENNDDHYRYGFALKVGLEF